jgi:hypothetical protein
LRTDTVQAVWCEPVSGSRSLICWENTGILSGARLLGGATRPNAASSRGHTGMFPEFGNREIRGNEHGFSRRESSSRTGDPRPFLGRSPQRSFITAGDGLVPRMPFGFGVLQLQCLHYRMSRDAAERNPPSATNIPINEARLGVSGEDVDHVSIASPSTFPAQRSSEQGSPR